MTTKANLIIDQGSVFYSDLIVSDENGDLFNLDGYTANSQIRRWYSSSNTAAVFTTAINTATGSVILSLTANQTSAIPAGRYVYDVEISDGFDTLRIVEGIITITPEVTR